MSISEGRILQLALARLEDKRRALDNQIAELRVKYRAGERGRSSGDASLQNAIESAQAMVEIKARRRMSDAQRMIISEKLKERWAQRKQQATMIDKTSPEYLDRMKPKLIKASQQQTVAQSQ